VQVEAGGQGPLPVLLLSIARDGDKPDIARLGLRTGHAGQLVAIHTRKAHVDQRDVRMELAELGEPLRSVARSLDDMARLLDPLEGMKTRELPGGTGPATVARALSEAEARLQQWKR